ncbi:Ig-like domain-containing protein, partial [Psychrobacter luti]
MNTITIKVNDQVKTIAEHKVVTQDGQPTVIKASSKVNYELLDEVTGRAPKHIITKRINKDLHISFEDDSENPDLIIEGFYNKVDSALIGLAEDGGYYYYIPDTGEIVDYVTELQIGDIEGQALGGKSQVMPWWIGATEGESFNALPWLVGLAGVGILGAALGGSSSNDSRPPIDSTAPDAPSVAINENGTVITGKTEPAATVNIDTNGDGKADYTVVADSNGNYTVDISDKPLTNGETIVVTATDKAGNISKPTTINATDSTAPNAPTDLVVSEDGSTLTGSGEPGAAVEIKDPTGNVIGEGVVAEDGTFEIDLTTPQLDGENLDVTLTDTAGNESDSGTALAPDNTAPDTPVVTINDDGSSVTVTGEVGAAVAITTPTGRIAGVIGADGTFTTVLTPALTNGEKVSATLTDTAGNTSQPGTDTAPGSLTDLAVEIAADGTSVTISNGTPGATVSITAADGTEIGTGTVGADGSVDVTLSPAQTNGGEITATTNDGETAVDTAPGSLTDLAVEIAADGTSVTISNGTPGATV